MEEITANVSWLAIIVGAVLSFLAGWLWYSEKLFGKKWAEGSKVELGDASDMPMGAMVTQGLGLLGLAWTIAVLAEKQMLMTTILMVVALSCCSFQATRLRKRALTPS